MHINSRPTPLYSHKNPTFGSLKVLRGSVVKQLAGGTRRRVPVEFHLLRAEDATEIAKLLPKWKETTQLGEVIVKLFTHCAKTPTPYSNNMYGTNFFALKPVNAGDFGTSEPLGFAVLTRASNKVNNEIHATLNYLQTASEYTQTQTDRKISGCGEMLMYGLSKFLESTNASSLRIDSLPLSKGFYQKLFKVAPTGFTERRFKITPQDISRFTEATEAKLGLPKGQELAQTTLDEIAKNNYMVPL